MDEWMTSLRQFWCIVDTWAPSSLSGWPRQILDDFVNQETNSTRIDSPLFVFIIRKTLNQCSFLFSARARAPGDCIAWFECASDLGLQLRSLSPTARSPEVLSGDA
jgi:hypothetical protein